MQQSHSIKTLQGGTPADPSSDPGAPSIWIRALSSLQCKTTVLFAILILVVTGGVTGYLLRHSARLVRASEEAHLVQVASLMADSVSPALDRGDWDEVRALATRLTESGSRYSVLISDNEGNLLLFEDRTSGRASLPLSAVPLPPEQPPGVLSLPAKGDRPSYLLVTYPIRGRSVLPDEPTTKGATLLGYVRIASPADQWERSMSSRLDLLVGVGIIVVLAFIPIGFLAVRRIVAPVEGLADSMSRFAAGDMQVRSSIDRYDEIGRLAQAFNRMAEHHFETHQGLVRLNAELEQRVASRTQQLREIASREPLTGLYNRRHFNEVLERRFAEAVRYDSELSCIMIDLDGFKHANDAFGHQVGDEILVLTASTILSQLRTSDLAARYGGDEFIILLPQTNAERAEVLADRIMQKFNREIERRYPDATVSMSVGVGSLKSLRLVETEELVRSADHAMYQAKSLGKNRIVSAAVPPQVEPQWHSP